MKTAKTLFYLGLLGLIVITVVLLKPNNGGGTQKGGVWQCHPHDLPFCQQGSFSADGFATEDECLKSCKYIPPDDEYWTCSGPSGTPPFTCIRTKTKTDWPVKDDPISIQKCREACFDATKYFRCTKSGTTPVNTGGCEVAAVRDGSSFQCAGGQQNCSDCPESQACKNPQNWACDTGTYQCVTVPAAFCQPPIGNGSRKCYQTVPGQEATYTEYDSCTNACVAPAPSPTPSPAPAPSPSPTGQGYRWERTANTCILDTFAGTPYENVCTDQATCTLTGTVQEPAFYKTFADCMCCECSKNSYQYCAGANKCCNPANCETCSQGQCVSTCNSDCKTCNGAGSCTNVYCTALYDKYCDTKTNTCKAFTDCGPNPNIQFDNTGQARWFCPDGGWCADKTNPLYSRTVRTDKTPGICPNGKDCIPILGESGWPPQGSKGCWPTVDPTLISDLPAI